MAEIFNDNFESGGFTNWTSMVDVTAVFNEAGMTPGYSALFGDNDSALTKVFSPALSEVYAAFDFMPPSDESSYPSGEVIAFKLGSTLLAYLQLLCDFPDGDFTLEAISPLVMPTTLATTTSVSFTKGTRCRIEVRFLPDPTNGYFQVKVGGTLVIDFSGPTTDVETTLDTVILGADEADSNNSFHSFYLGNVLMDDSEWPVQTYPIPCTAGIVLGATIAPVYQGTSPTVVPCTTGLVLGASCFLQSQPQAAVEIPCTPGLYIGASLGLAAGASLRGARHLSGF